MTSRAGTRLGRVKKLARAGGYIAMCSVGAVVLWPGWWTWVAVGCTVALPALSSIAAIAELHADGKRHPLIAGLEQHGNRRHCAERDESAGAPPLRPPLLTRADAGHHAVPPPSARRRSAVPLGRRAPARAALAWTAPPAVSR